MAARTKTDLAELVHPSWVPALAPVEHVLADLRDRLRDEVAAGRPFEPPGHQILRAFQTPLSEVRVLLVGQDPYPTPGHAVGLSFSVSPQTQPLPRSLRNIFVELVDDLGVAQPRSGDLSPWSTRGVLLLNRVLTVRSGMPGSHRGWGWEQVTDAAVQALARRHEEALTAILWGRDAQAIRPLLGAAPVVTSAHPSPLSAARGFFGSRPFSRTNAALARLGAQPIDWSLP